MWLPVAMVLPPTGVTLLSTTLQLVNCQCCRALAKEDDIESLTSRAGSYAKRVRWVNANRDAIVTAVKDKMLALATAAA